MARGNRFHCVSFAVLTLTASGILPAQNVTFVPLSQVSTGSKPDALALGDFNGDGIPDVAVANSGTQTVSVLRGIGNGFFAALTTFTTGQSPRAIVTGDFNRDGKLDLAVANFGSNNISIFLGNGNGTFRAFGSYPVAGPVAIAVADFNGDGKLDLGVVATNSNTVAIFVGTGSGDFLPFFTAATGGRPLSVATADFNGDGKLDLAVANSTSNDVSILLGNGNGTFQSSRSFAAGDLPSYVTTGDFNGDGLMDLAVTNATGFSSGSISVLLSQGNGTFQAPRTFTGGANPSFLVAADFNLDGKLDLAVANAGSDSVSIFLGIGNGEFLAPQDFTAGSSPAWLAVADFKRDGRPDLLVANSDSDSLSVLINQTAAADAGRPNVSSTVNAGSMKTGPVAPGELVTVFGSNLGPNTPAGLQISDGAVATTLSATQVFFDDIAAPLVYASAEQVTAAVPFGVAGRPTTQLTIVNAGQTSASSILSVAGSAPALFTVDSSGSGAGAILNSDLTLNTNTNPASRGSVIVLFITGAGATNPPSADGLLASKTLATIASPVSATIGGQSAQVLYAGSAPGMIAGVAQINVQVPDGVSSGTVPIAVQIGPAISQPNVTVNVR